MNGRLSSCLAALVGLVLLAPGGAALADSPWNWSVGPLRPPQVTLPVYPTPHGVGVHVGSGSNHVGVYRGSGSFNLDVQRGSFGGGFYHGRIGGFSPYGLDPAQPVFSAPEYGGVVGPGDSGRSTGLIFRYMW